MPDQRVAVIGGGPAGLLCAYLLKKKVPDAKVTVFSAAPRLGGKILTDEFSGGEPFEAGVGELRGDDLRLLVEEELDLPTADLRGGAAVLRGRVVRDLDDLQRKFGEPTRNRVEAGEHGDDCEAADYAALAAEDGSPFYVVGGMRLLAEALAGGAAADYREQARVVSVGREGENYALGVLDHGDDRTEEYDAVFACLPAHWLDQIRWRGAELRRGIRRLLDEAPPPEHRVRASLLFDKPWWKRHRIPGDHWGMDCLGGCRVYDEGRRRGRAGGDVLSFVCSGRTALALCAGGHDDRAVVEYVLGDLPPKWRARAERHLVEFQVDRHAGSYLEGEHRPDPGDHPRLYVVGGADVAGALAAAQAATDLYAGELGVVAADLEEKS